MASGHGKILIVEFLLILRRWVISLIDISNQKRPVITPLGRFNTVAAAATKHHLTVSEGEARAQSRTYGWQFETDTPPGRPERAIPVSTPAGDFATMKAAAAYFGISRFKVIKKIAHGDRGWSYK